MKNLLTVLLILLLLQQFSCKSQYKVTKTTETLTSVTLQLQYFGKDDYHIKNNNPIIKKLKFIFQALARGQFYFKITDLEGTRFELPKGDPFPYDQYQKFSFPLSAMDVQLSYTEIPFDFQIMRIEPTLSVLFSTYKKNFIFSDHYIQIGTQLNSNQIFGLGERFSLNFRKTEGKWTIFNRANDQQIDRGQGVQTYGYYPFYLLYEINGDSHINYLKSTHPMDVFKSIQDGKNYLTYKIVGGILNFRFVLGQQPVDTLNKFFQGCIGQVAIPPFWSLGFHQSRWGYDSAQALQQVIKKYKQNGLPLDTIWSDIDYMLDFKDFLVDEENFPLSQMKKITDQFRYVPIVDAGVAVDSQFYEEGHKRDIFIKDADGQEYIGLVWPGETTFVDYFHPNATKYWKDMLSGLNSKLNFSGLWLDMNEIQNFCDGPCSFSNKTSIFDYTNDLPYQPGRDSIQTGTISLNCTHYGGIKQFDTHPLFPLMEVYATHQYLKTKGRPFILSRSTTFGSNRYAFHWTGDNHASWQFLRSSIIDNMNMNIAGLQMVGPDICGFGGNTTQELCARWYQLAAAYPFARSHSDFFSDPQQPYSLGKVVLQSALGNLKLRYSLLKQYYSYMISNKGKNPFFLSLALVPTCISTVSPVESQDRISNTQFFIGDSYLMAAPILEDGATFRTVYFPFKMLSGYALWRDFHSGQTHEPGSYEIIQAKLTDKLPLFMLQGFLYFIQNVTTITKTSQLKDNFILIAAFRYSPEFSTSQYKVYGSQGSIASIADYNNDKTVDACLANDCSYEIRLYLSIKRADSSLSLEFTTYRITPQPREPIYIQMIRIYIQKEVINFKLPNKIQIYDNVNVTIPITRDQSKDIDFWEDIQVSRKIQKHLLTES